MTAVVRKAIICARVHVCVEDCLPPALRSSASPELRLLVHAADSVSSGWAPGCNGDGYDRPDRVWELDLRGAGRSPA